MTRSVAIRALTLFIIAATVFASIGIASHVPVAEALFVLCGSLGALMFVCAMSMPAHAPVLVRVRRHRR
jgi:hypothetical protein